MRIRSRAALFVFCAISLNCTAQEYFPKIHNFKADRGPTSDLSELTNDSCRPIAQLDSAVTDYITRYGIAGASLAISRHDSLLYVKGYGLADRENKEPMQPSSLMRIASVSKLITATGIMKMQEEGLLNLSDKVFTPDAPLGREDFTGCIRDKRMYDITIEHLLRHQGGFTTPVRDPMFCVGVTNGRDAVRESLSTPLGYTPGTSQEYSNVGYYLLGLIIENISGQSYDKWINDNILIPMQCTHFHIAGNYQEDRIPGEVHYYVPAGTKPVKDYHDDGRTCIKCYGSNNVTGAQGAGAWMASAPELCRFVCGINNDIGIRDLLQERSVVAMTAPVDSVTYALGWNDSNGKGVWTRTGSFAGTAAMVKYFSDKGDCWVLIFNSSTIYNARIASRTAAMIERIREKVLPLLPEKDLFYDR